MGSWDFLGLFVGCFVAAGALLGRGLGLRELLKWLRRRGWRRRGVDVGEVVLTHYKVKEPNPGYEIAVRSGDDGQSGLEGLSEQSQDSPEPQFTLRFGGEGWRGGALRRGLRARLIFSDLADPKAYARFSGSKFAAVNKTPEAQLTLVLHGGAGVTVNQPVQLAQFVDGQLQQEVAFDLDVAASGYDHANLTLQFFAATALLYGLTLPVPVADALAPDLPPADPPPLIDLDAGGAQQADKVLPERQLLLYLSLSAEGLVITLGEFHHGVADALSSACVRTLTQSSLQALLDRLQSELGADFFEAESWDSANPQPVHLAACLERAASAGSLLYEELSLGDEARQLLARINAQPDGTRLTVSTAGVTLPLELMYPYEFDKRWPTNLRERALDVRDFWGARFAIEVLHADGRGRELKQRHRDAAPRVSLNIDTQIGGEGVARIHQALSSSLQQLGVGVVPAMDCEAMKRVLLAAQTDAVVIYVYCHGAGASPQRGASESLMLDFDCEINPGAIHSRSRYLSAPILILNACNSGTTSPVLSGGFLQAFRRQDALGMIATSFYVPMVFGAKFGAELVQACLDRTRPLAENVRRLRATYAQEGNPAPLFYSVQCQLEPERPI
ncbi:MAG: hypothetical protein JNN30_12250 [Rhodanobacteraceae bacterium]|nr:hypothetical protein [Rhodanobacteraceae bacterium]